MPLSANSLTTNNWLRQSTKKLEEVGIATARLDCLVLLEDATGKDRSYLLAHDNEELKPKVVQKLSEQVKRRAKHEPLAYIRGKSEFYGREFIVNHHTLQPRPETETMITLVKTHILLHLRGYPLNNINPVIVDVGTGSGCIGVSVKLEWPETEVVGVDISDECLKIARKNADLLHADVVFYKSNLLESVKDTNPDVLLCNLPYVPNEFTINQAAMQEPDLAIFGGVDGLDYYRELFNQIKTFELKPRCILTESLPFQHHVLASIARKYGYTLEKTDDFIQLFSH